MKPFVKFCALCLSALIATAAVAQTYPSKSITLIVPFSSGGPTDTVAHTIAASMQKRLRQTIVIENVGGAGGTIGAARLAAAPPDGYTVLLHHIGMATAPSLYTDLGFDPLKSFDTIGEVTDVPMTIIARPDFPAKDLKEFLRYLKANRANVVFGHSGPGSASHFCGLMFMSAIGLDLKTAGYKGTGPAMNDLLAGKIDFICDQTTNTIPQIRSEKVKAYAITTPKRVALLPDVPTLQEGGLTGFELAVWHVLYVPAGTPREAIEKLNDALRFALMDAGVRARFSDLGTEPVPLEKATPEYARKHLESAMKQWAPIIKKARQYAD